MEDLTLMLIMLLVFFSIGILCIIFPHPINRFIEQILLNNENSLRKVPIIGLYIRDIILSEENPTGDSFVRTAGAIIIIATLLLVL